MIPKLTIDSFKRRSSSWCDGVCFENGCKALKAKNKTWLLKFLFGLSNTTVYRNYLWCCSSSNHLRERSQRWPHFTKVVISSPSAKSTKLANGDSNEDGEIISTIGRTNPISCQKQCSRVCCRCLELCRFKLPHKIRLGLNCWICSFYKMTIDRPVGVTNYA